MVVLQAVVAGAAVGLGRGVGKGAEEVSSQAGAQGAVVHDLLQSLHFECAPVR